MPTPLLDQREGENFIFTSAYIKAGIQVRLLELKTLINGYRKEVHGELEGKPIPVLCDTLLAVYHEKNLDPSAILIRESFSRISALEDEVLNLQAVYNSVENPYCYQLTLEQVIRYGLAQPPTQRIGLSQ